MKKEMYLVIALIMISQVACSMGFVPRNLTPAKAYGEYWTKPGVTTESWRQDWVACGGMSNGNYSGDAPTGSTTEVIFASDRQKKKKLDACMQSKGYEYRYTGPK
jgi:hypothetical protein